MSKEWFYIENNGSKGPFSEEEMRVFYAENKIGLETPVWGGYGDKWIPLKYYGLHLEDDGEMIEVGTEKHPEDVKNYPVWGFALPIFILLLLWSILPDETLYNGLAFILYSALNIAFLKFDKKNLKKGGIRIGSAKSAIAFPPIYIWRRNKILGRSKIGPVSMWLMAAAIGMMSGLFVDAETLTDARDGKVYNIVSIGNQIWMAENLNYEIDSESFCYSDNDECVKYGRLYTWKGAMNACPNGWHLPNKQEFESLLGAVGDVSHAGKKLKSNYDWLDDGNGSDDFGFSVKPSGEYKEGSECDENGSECEVDAFIGKSSGFWTSTSDEFNAVVLSLHSYSEESVLDLRTKETFYSVRCIKDSD